MSKKIIYIVITFLLILVLCGLINFNNKEEKMVEESLREFNDYEFKIDSNNKYEIITDMKWKTMLNDGGSNTDIYYQLDLDNNIVSKIKEKYYANLGNKPKLEKEIIYIKKIDLNIKKEAELLLNDIISRDDVKEDNYNSFSILSLNFEKEIYNADTIENINKFLDKIDEL